MDFQEIVNARYATKQFTGEKIPEADFGKLKNLITLSASSFGLQPYRIHVITNEETKKQLTAAAWGQPQVTTASHLLIFEPRLDLPARIKQYAELMRSHGYPEEKITPYIDMMSGAVGNLPADVAKIWAEKQIYLAVGNAINGAKALGYDSCPMEGFDKQAFQTILGTENAPAVMVAVGIAADSPRPKLRFTDLFVEH